MLAAGTVVHTLGPALKSRYGRRLRRIMLDLGLTCPNRDGQSGYGGCIYCDLEGSGTGASKARQSLPAQFEEGLQRVRRSQPEGPAAISYLQSYSNTYPDLVPLAESLAWLSTQTQSAPIVSIGTRPDCFSAEAAALLGEHRKNFAEVWIEFGLETADDEVQKTIGRPDTLENYKRACALAHKHDLGFITHTIAGLPGEREVGLLRQVEEARNAGSHGIKFHQLMVLRKTKLEHLWRSGEVRLLTPDEYVALVADALERLPTQIVVHRLVAENPPDRYLAPENWPSRAKVHSMIEQELKVRGTHQGSRL